MGEMKLEVDCYSGRTADERPVRFRLEDCQYMVEEVLDQWYGPQDAFYKVRADDGNLVWSRNSKGLKRRGLQARLVSSDCLAAKMSFLTLREFYLMTRKRLRRRVVEFVGVRGFDDPQGQDSRLY